MAAVLAAAAAAAAAAAVVVVAVAAAAAGVAQWWRWPQRQPATCNCRVCGHTILLLDVSLCKFQILNNVQ